ncbi:MULTISPECIES: RES family NAD+ phosphorylase [unclassified Streptomyces]|uniref:RES family NAD+ phosphorylase n=1 Tax=unclassified Streptomyces TaxID=2593676 RepID=UPI00214B400C|nr:RES family NAD+ phosphorylase [Streptomyces sp. NBC_00162]UUU45151.1 RES family NAD+ phosphorylase [Streptomyces sp. NBC_00162]
MNEATRLQLIAAPEHGVWHLGKAKDPLKYNKISKADNNRTGGNLWSLVGYGTLYCSSELDGCFAEALEPFRVDPELQALIADDWRTPDFMPPGTLPRDWRTRHTLVRLQPTKEARFLNIDDEEALRLLSRELKDELAVLGVPTLTREHIRGSNRRVTRQIAAWAITQRTPEQGRLIHGIAYRSRFGMRQCWAIFSDVDLEEIEQQPIWPETEGLRTVADEYGLTIR